MAGRETVVVVHGTWSGRAPGGAHGWYAPGQPFCQQLDEALAARGSSARCWAHLEAADGYFSWDGANDWLSRSRAATRLRGLVRDLGSRGWTVHLVGHSHGGNVIIDALVGDGQHVEPWFDGRVALLGTPIYAASITRSSRLEALRRRWWLVSAAAWASVLAIAARGVDLGAAFVIGSATEAWGVAAGLVALFAALALLGRAARSFFARSIGLLPPSLYIYFFAETPRGTTRRSPPFLLVNSRSDEAWRSLVEVPGSENPLLDAEQVRTVSTGAAVRAVVEAALSRSSAVIVNTLRTRRIGIALALGTLAIVALLQWRAMMAMLGYEPSSVGTTSLVFWWIVAAGLAGAVFYRPLLVVPGIALAEGTAAIVNSARGLAFFALDRPIRNGVWSFLRAASLGLSGAPQQVQDVTVARQRDYVSPLDSIYLELPDDVVAGVKAQQKQQLHTVHDLLYRDGTSWSPTSLRKELEAVGFPLVHTAYYREPECIEQLAGWIAEPNKQLFDGTRKVKTTVNQGPPERGVQNQIEEEIELANEYQSHLRKLGEKFCPPGSKWSLRKPQPVPSLVRESHGAIDALSSPLRLTPPKAMRLPEDSRQPKEP